MQERLQFAMDKETMRKRGWSIHSDQTRRDDGDDEPDSPQHFKDDLNDDEKKRLLNSFPDAEESGDDYTIGSHKGVSVLEKTNGHGDGKHQAGETHRGVAYTTAKTKLSKWAARLFDPDRPRGVVEPPQVIPLNDEFLTAFGKREKAYDEKLGRTMDLNSTIEDEDLTRDDAAVDLTSAQATNAAEEVRKVKISNLLFTMSADVLRAACERFGPLEEVNLIMDRDQPERNTGRAYVTFQTVDGATACVDKLETLGGRQLRVSLSSDTHKRSRNSTGGAGGGMLARYWDKDISTKCFRCGQVGHMEASCPNEAKPKPCPLCAQTAHDFRRCAISRICFRCGIPGHINRDCNYKYNLPKRMVCSICFRSGHHHTTCQGRAQDAPSQDAKCMVCHKRGHFLCTEMKWFFGLEGVSCFNCGRSGHHGFDCKRPTVDMCGRDEGLAVREIERATAESLADEVNRQREQRGRNDNRDHQQDRSRAKSQDPAALGYRGRGYAPSQGNENKNDVGKRKFDPSRWSDDRNQKRRR